MKKGLLFAALFAALCGGALARDGERPSIGGISDDLKEMRAKANGARLGAERLEAIRSGSCHFSTTFRKPDSDYFERCWKVVSDKPNIMLIGDSYAGDFYVALQAAYPELNILQATGPGINLSNLAMETTENTEGEDFFRIALNKGLENPEIDAIFIHGHARSFNDASMDVLRALIDGKKPVYLFGPRLTFEPQPRAYFLGYFRGQPKDAESFVQSAVTGKRAQWSIEPYKENAPDNLHLIDTAQLVCPQMNCRFFTPDLYPVVIDRGHWSAPGAKWIGAQIKQQYPDLLDIR